MTISAAFSHQKKKTVKLLPLTARRYTTIVISTDEMYDQEKILMTILRFALMAMSFILFLVIASFFMGAFEEDPNWNS